MHTCHRLVFPEHVVDADQVALPSMKDEALAAIQVAIKIVSESG